MPLTAPPISRRHMLAGTGAAALTVASVKASTAPAASGYTYEITRTEAEWREMLSDYEYAILREGKTEKPKTSPLWEETAEGSYHCRGCELKVFEGRWKTNLEKGWVFFFHAEPDSVLMGIDGQVAEYGSMSAGYAAMTEIHCRRCASHLGHFLIVEDLQRHCINGTALTFQPTSA
jgi:peptide-methionine (R)-S-oxide reductase